MSWVRAEEGRYQMEFRLMQPDGATRRISCVGRVEFDAAGQPVLMRGTCRDVTAEFLAQREHEDAPGCVLADVRMPGMNGLELQSALAQSRNPLPILVLTGHGDIPSSVSAMRDGAEDCLEKRAPKEQLLGAVARRGVRPQLSLRVVGMGPTDAYSAPRLAKRMIRTIGMNQSGHGSTSRPMPGRSGETS